MKRWNRMGHRRRSEPARLWARIKWICPPSRHCCSVWAGCLAIVGVFSAARRGYSVLGPHGKARAQVSVRAERGLFQSHVHPSTTICRAGGHARLLRDVQSELKLARSSHRRSTEKSRPSTDTSCRDVVDIKTRDEPVRGRTQRRIRCSVQNEAGLHLDALLKSKDRCVGTITTRGVHALVRPSHKHRVRLAYA